MATHPHQPANDPLPNIIVPVGTKVVPVLGSDAAGSLSVPKSEAGGSEEQPQQQQQLPVKRGRGRPRKYDPNGGGLLSPAPASAPPPPPPGFMATPVGSAAATTVVKRGRGRPRGSGKLQILASIGGDVADTAGGSFTPYVMTVNTGEDVVSRIISFFHKGPRSVCVISATGDVSSVVIRQSGVTLRYEGRFEIISLTGSCTYSIGPGGALRKDGVLSVSLAKPDGNVFGGGIESSLIAAGPIQLVMATFKQNIIKEIKKKNSSDAPDDYLDSAGRRHKIANLFEGEQSFTSPAPSALPLKPTTNGGVSDDGVTLAAAAPTNGGGGPYAAIPAAATIGVSHNVITEDLNIVHSDASPDVDTSVPQM